MFNQIKMRAALLVGATVFAVVPVVHADVELKFGVYTSDKATDMVKQFRPVLDELEKSMTEQLKTPVKISMKISSSYQEGIDMIANGSVDIAEVGPVSYVQVKEKNPNVTILATETEKGQKVFQGVIAVHKDSAIKDLPDLKGKKFAFGDEMSTIGRYLSQQLLMDKGIYAKDLGHYEYLGRHDKVGAAVASKEFDAGALKEGAYKKLVAAGSPLRVLVSFPNVTKPWVGRAGLDEKVVAAARTSLLALKSPTALEALGQDGFTAGNDADYASTRQALKENSHFVEGATAGS